MNVQVFLSFFNFFCLLPRLCTIQNKTQGNGLRTVKQNYKSYTLLRVCEIVAYASYMQLVHIQQILLTYVYIYCGNFKYAIKYLYIARGYCLIGNICGTNIGQCMSYITLLYGKEQRNRNRQKKRAHEPTMKLLGRLIHTDLLCTLS